MDQQHTPEQVEKVDGQKSLGQTTEPCFSLPMRNVHGQPPQDIQPSTDNHGVLSDNFKERKTEFGATFVKRYLPRRLGPTTWKCKICGGKATQLIHATASLPPDLKLSGSTVGDELIPICRNKECQSEANAIAESFFQNGSPNSERMNCESCARDSKMRLCAACRFTREWGFGHRVCNNFLILSHRWLSKVSRKSQQEKVSRDYDEQREKILETQEGAKLLKMGLWARLQTECSYYLGLPVLREREQLTRK